MEENVYNSSLQIMLSKSDEQPWGFRITGGADFGTPVTIIKVYGGSIAEQAGLQVDDILVGINDYPITSLSHQEAYQTFVNAGNSFLLSIVRGSQVSSPPSNMTMEMAYLENEYVNTFSQEFNTSENITATEVFEQQTVEEQTDSTMPASQPEFGLDAIIAAVLSQGTTSQDATESETFNDVYVNKDTEKQFEDLSYLITEKALNTEDLANSTYQMEEVEDLKAKDYKDESYTMEKHIVADQQLEAEDTETKADYLYSEQQLEAQIIDTKVIAEEMPLIQNVMPDTGIEQQHSDLQLKDNIEKNHAFLPLMVHPRPVLEAEGIKLTLPKELYNDEFIAETLSGNAEIITGTTLGVNFHKYRRNYDFLKSSSVYQLIHEEESKSTSTF